MPRGRKAAQEQPVLEEEDEDGVQIAPLSTVPAPPSSRPNAPPSALRKARVRNQPSFEQGRTDNSSPKPTWARGELSWLVEFGRRDEHVLRIERRLQTQERAWRLQAAEAGCHRPLGDKASRPSTTSRSECRRSPKPSVPTLDLERMLPEVAPVASRRASTARMLSRSSARSPRERTSQSPRGRGRGALTERSRPSTQHSAKEDLLAEDSTYQALHHKLVVLGERRQQLAEEDFQGEMHQKQADIAQSILHQNDPLALTATVGSKSEIRRAKSSRSQLRKRGGSPRKQNSGMLWDGEEQMLSMVFDNESLWTEMDVDERSGGFPAMEGTESWEAQASARLEIHGAVEEGDEGKQTPSPSKSRRDKAGKRDKDRDAEHPAHPLGMNKAEEQEMSTSISAVRAELKSMNAAIGDWLRAGGTKVYVDRLSNHVKIRSWKDSAPEAKPGTIARSAASGMQNLQQVLEGKLPRSDPRQDPDAPDHIGCNKALLDVMRPGVRNTKLLSQTMHRYRRSELVQQRRFETEKMRVERIKAEVEGKMVGTRELRKLEEAEEHAARSNHQSFIAWMLVVTAAWRVKYILWRGKQKLFRRAHAARCIQRQFREFAAGRRKRGGRLWAKGVLRHFLMTVLGTVRFNRNGSAIATLKLFLYNLQEQAKVMPAILKFKRKIILVQSLIRGFLTRVRNANAHNSGLWDKVEQRELRLLYKDRAKKHGMVMSGKVATTHQFVLEHQVPPIIKKEAFRKWLAAQREEFHLRQTVHKVELAGYNAQVERKHIMTLRLMEFTGETQYSKVEEQAERLGGGRYNHIATPKPVKFRDLCTEHEAKTLWLQAATHHGSPELKAFLLEHCRSLGPDATPLDATATSISFDSLPPGRLRRDGSAHLESAGSRLPRRRPSGGAGGGAPSRLKQPAAVFREASSSSFARRSSSGSSAGTPRPPPSLSSKHKVQPERSTPRR